MSRKDESTNSSLDFIFRTPKKLTFTQLYRYYFQFILRLLYRIILLDNVPETIEETFLKLILYTQGKICFLDGQQIGESENELLALNCSRADTPNVYYIPRRCIVTNPRLKKAYNLTPGENCEIVYLSEADKYNISEISGGLFELIRRTAVMLADNDISINISQKNTRLTNLVSGDTQNTVNSIRAVIAAMYEGDPTIVVKSSMIDKLQGIPIIQNTSNRNLIDLIEVQQYIIAHFYEQIGICTHDQMKRERLITAEINDNLDLAFLNIDDIVVSVQEGLQRVNAMFGTNITARLNPIIEQQRAEREAGAQEAAPGDNLPDETPNEEPEEESSPGLIEEQKPEPDAEPEEEAAAEDQEEEAAAEDQEEEAAAEDQKEEAAAEDQEEEAASQDQSAEAIEITIEGDNNIILVGGEDNAGNLESGADALPDLESDNVE